MWISSFVPAFKVGLGKVQSMINAVFESPLIGMVAFGAITFIYLTTYYISPSSVDNASQKYVSQFINFWILFLTTVVVVMAVYTMFSRKK